MKNFDIVIGIVNHEQGSRVLRIGKEHGVKFGTIFLGMGTIKNKLMEFFEINDSEKEVVVMICPHSNTIGVMEAITKEMHLFKRNHGIIFANSIDCFIGAKEYELYELKDKEVADTMYNAIFAVVEKGLAEEVIDAASKAGSRGGTIINARGSDIYDTSKLFAMAIEPEKEIVLILAERKITADISKAICDNLKIDVPGNGIVFVIDVREAYGLH